MIRHWDEITPQDKQRMDAERHARYNARMGRNGDIPMEKTLTNTTAKGAKAQVKDIEFWGDGDTFKLLCKASSQSEGWMKSSKAMEIEGVGCVIQVTTQQGANVAEAVTFVPGVKIQEVKDAEQKVVQRRLVALDKDPVAWL